MSENESISTQSTIVLGTSRYGKSCDTVHEDIIFTVKIIVIGDYSVGKTSLVGCFLQQEFDYTYKATIGVDFNTRIMRIYPNVIVRFQLWDLAGQERFQSISKSYYREAHAVIIVADASQKNFGHVVHKWYNSFAENFDDGTSSRDAVPIRDILSSKYRSATEPNDLRIPPDDLDSVVFALALNKCDLVQKQTPKVLLPTKKDFDFVLQTSAKTQHNVERLFFNVGKKCVDRIFARMRHEKLALTKTMGYDSCRRMNDYWRLRVPKRNTEQLQKPPSQPRPKDQECPCLLL